MNADVLNLLERKIDMILSQHSAVCEERDRLSEKLAEAERRLQEMSRKLEQSERDRAEIRARVECILERLNGLDLE